MAIQGVIFDLGHTLMHLDGTWPEVFDRGRADLQAFLGAQGLDLDAASFARTLLDRRAEGYDRAKATQREVTAVESMRWTFARFGLVDPAPDLLQGAIDAFFAYEYDHWQADPEALPLLKDLAARGLRLGMFSNATDDSFIQRLVDRFGFRPWLEPALSSAGTGIRKPDPAAFAPILDVWGLEPGSITVVGDTLDADILGANRAGMQGVWIRARQDARQEGAAPALEALGAPIPNAIIDRLAQLPEALIGDLQ